MKTSELIRYFKEDCFLPQIKSTNQEGVLEELLNPLIEKNLVKSRNLVLATLIKRETLGSTGIGKGVAVPHCRTTAVSDIRIVVGMSPEGVEYQAIDGKPVYVFFLILAPPQEEANQYLPVLGKIVELIRNDAIRAELTACSDFDSFKTIIERG